MSMQTHVLLSTVHVAEACMPLIDVANHQHQYCGAAFLIRSTCCNDAVKPELRTWRIRCLPAMHFAHSIARIYCRQCCGAHAAICCPPAACCLAVCTPPAQHPPQLRTLSQCSTLAPGLWLSVRLSSGLLPAGAAEYQPGAPTAPARRCGCRKWS